MKKQLTRTVAIILSFTGFLALIVGITMYEGFRAPKTEDYYMKHVEKYGHDIDGAMAYLNSKLDGCGVYDYEELDVKERVTQQYLLDLCQEECGNDKSKAEKYLDDVLTKVNLKDSQKTSYKEFILSQFN